MQRNPCYSRISVETYTLSNIMRSDKNSSFGLFLKPYKICVRTYAQVSAPFVYVPGPLPRCVNPEMGT